MKRRIVGLSCAALLAVLSAPMAQNLDYGAWCATVAKFSPDRCIEERPEDRTAYEKYLGTPLLFNKELNRQTEADRLEVERVNRMGDVTPGDPPGSNAAVER